MLLSQSCSDEGEQFIISEVETLIKSAHFFAHHSENFSLGERPKRKLPRMSLQKACASTVTDVFEA